MSGNSDAVTTSYRSLPHPHDPNTLASTFHSAPSRTMLTQSHSVDIDGYSNRRPPMMCSQQQRLASFDESILPRGQPPESLHHPRAHRYSELSHVSTGQRGTSHAGNLPSKKNCSVSSLHNERYALDAPSTKDHENEDEFLIHANYRSLCLCCFDGHDGPRAVKFVKRYMKANIFDTKSWIDISEKDNHEEIECALAEFIKVTDADFFKNIKQFIEEKVYLQSQIPKVII